MSASTTHSTALAAIEAALEVEAAATPGPWQAMQYGLAWEVTDADLIVLARALVRRSLLNAKETLEQHRPTNSSEPCEVETYSWDHYSSEMDPYWIRCQETGQHDEHNDSGNTGLTWPLTDEDRRQQEFIALECDDCGHDWPCPDAQRALALVNDIPEGGAK